MTYFHRFFRTIPGVLGSDMPSALGLVLFGKGSEWKLSIRLHSF